MNINNTNIPELSVLEILNCFDKANMSARRRYPQILHEPGSEFNRVFNFMKKDTYMQPHLHPGKEKIENIYLIMGNLASIFFNNKGKIVGAVKLEKGKKELIEIPAFTWHTYVMLSDEVLTYETMMGKYDPETWKKPAHWAPGENTEKSPGYLNWLRQKTLEIIN